MDSRVIRKSNNRNYGFTLVEMIVVLVLLVILLTLGIGGLFAWQDWSRFKQENTSAELIFYAAQNQLNELSLNGMMDDKVKSVLESDLSGNLRGKPGAEGYFNGSTISYDAASGGTKYYAWDASESRIWKNSPAENNLAGSDDKISNYQGSIYYLSADRGDYSAYLDGTLKTMSGKEGAVLLFDLVAPYISDKSVLNGAILMELSPEAGQVFSVCYSDRVESFGYVDSSTAGITSVLDRTEDARWDLMMGYYAAESLSVPLLGHSRGIASSVNLINGNTLDLVIQVMPSVFSGAKYNIVLYRGSENEAGKELLSFKLDNVDTTNKTAEDAGKNPSFVDATFYYGPLAGCTVNIPFPVWVDTGDGDIIYNDENEQVYDVHVVLDAADVQAQSKLLGTVSKDDLTNPFFNTYSFYRFGFNMNSLKCICCGVSTDTNNGPGEEAKSNAEHPTFASVEKVDGDRVYGIDNGRHLYNVRFETDYKNNDNSRIFKLQENIDWYDFINYKNTPGASNYFLNSLAYNAKVADPTKKIQAGICFDGNDYYANRVNSIDTSSPAIYDTKAYAFPGFRQLSEGDVFTGRVSEDSDETYTISNLVISFGANVRYGVYDTDVKYSDIWTANISSYGDYITKTEGGKTVHESANLVHKAAMKGNCPLGLFAENSGEISYVTLNRHRVYGMEKRPAEGGKLSYTNMVGGFVGNNLGVLDHLKIRNVNELDEADLIEYEPTSDGSNPDPSTHINGKSDVGGIVGRQSWVNEHYSLKSEIDSSLTVVTLDHLENYGKVTGMENVGGIVGKAYVLRENPHNGNSNTLKKRIPYYNDGYDLFGTAYQLNGSYEDVRKTFTDQKVDPVGSIVISNCINRGSVSGDSNVYSNVITVYDASGKGLTNNQRRCAFIGGIAGITIDGLISDTGDYEPYSEALKTNPRMIVENCSSYRLYRDETVNSLGSINGFPSDIMNHIEHDYYVGGLIGYARITSIKDCNNNAGNNNTRSFVFGRNYVGGLFGCFDLSFIQATTLINDRYNIVNDINTIGIMYVGGFAGGTGIGDDSRDTFYVAFPANNEGSQPSDINGMQPSDAAGAEKKHITGVLNEAVVLGMRRELLTYVVTTNTENFSLYRQDAAIGKGVKSEHIVRNYPDACVGGVVGCTSMFTSNFDNIQNQNTKALALRLIGIGNKQYNDINYNDVAGTWGNSVYGGNGVGGIYGKVLQAGNVNKLDTEFSICDAVVYGENAVGGIIGGNQKSKDIRSSRMYNQGSLVMGQNMVGGIIGAGNQNIHYTFTKVDKDCGDYRVYGKYGVGGYAGVIGLVANSNINNNDLYTMDAYINKHVVVQGKAYVGGCAGVCCSKINYFEFCVDNIDVRAEYFAGGFAGAIYSNYVVNNSCQNVNTFNLGRKGDNDFKKNIKLDDITVTATGAFAGGYSGLYAYHKGLGNNDVADDLSEKITETQTTFSSLTGDNRNSGYLVQLIKSIENSQSSGVNYGGLINVLEDSETNTSGDCGLNPNNGGGSPSHPTLTFQSNVLTGENMKVEAPVFAGGVFGYIPSGVDLTVDFGDKNITCEVKTTNNMSSQGAFAHDSIGQEKNQETDAYGSDIKISYAGGIIGRVPSGLTVTKASYTGVLMPNSSYLGQIAEVNDGVITGCKVKAFADEDLENANIVYAGGLVGLNSINGKINLDGVYSEKITLTGNKVLGGFIGRNIADITVTDLYTSDSFSINNSTLTIKKDENNEIPAGSSIGLIMGENAAKLDVKNSVVASNNNINGADSAGLYTGINSGIIEESAVNNIFNADGVEGRYLSDVASVYGLNAKLSVTNINKTGLLTGKNIGIVNYVVTSSDANKSSLTSDGIYMGGFVGQNGDGAKEGIINNCINYMNVSGTADESYAAGIAGVAGGKSTISICDNRASISAKTSASGILGWSSDGVTSENSNIVEECVNMGTITAEADNSTAGIAGKVNYGKVELCRNYGSAAYGMSASADNEVTFYANLEASGNNEGVDNSDAEDAQLTLNPIAPIDDRSALERNYYIYGSYSGELTNIGEGYYTQKYVGPGSEGHTFKDIDFTQNESYDENASDYFTGQNIISDASGLDVMDAFKSWYLRGYNAQGFIQSIRPENGNYIRSLYNKMAGQNYNGGNLNQDFQNLLYGVFAIYYNHVGNDDDTWGVHYTTVLGVRVVSRVVANYDGLIDLIHDIVGPVENIGNPDNHDNNIIPARFGTTVYKDGYTVGVDENTVTDVLQDTTSHWPKQLYYHKDDAGVGSLVYHRWNSYYAAPIGGLDNSVMSSADNMFSQIDKQFVDMVKNEDEYPNYDVYSDGNLVKQGFLPGESTP